MTAFPEDGKKYSIEDLPVEIQGGRHRINLNGVEVTLFVTGGTIFIAMEDGAKLVDYSAAGYRRRIIKIEEETRQQLRFKFGGRETYMKLEDVKKIFFTPQPVDTEQVAGDKQ